MATITKLDYDFVDESVGGSTTITRSYRIDNDAIIDSTVYDTVPAGKTKVIDAAAMNAIVDKINEIIDNM